jgi:outer membrane immunogenic protein
MQIRVATTAALLLVLTGASLAADLPGSEPLEAFDSVPAFTWTGGYIGLAVGYGFGSASLNTPVAASGIFKTSGPNYASTLGYIEQSGSIVYGLEGDFALNWDSGTNSAISPCHSCQVTNPWLATIRGRAGYAQDTMLFYATGGLAYGEVRVKDSLAGEEAHNKTGWALGAGTEYAFASAYSVKFEYLYVDLGHTGFGDGMKTRFNENILRVGLNGHF